MKLIWSKDHKQVILVAETKAEVAFCDLVGADLNAQKYKMTKDFAEYMIKPEEKL